MRDKRGRWIKGSISWNDGKKGVMKAWNKGNCERISKRCLTCNKEFRVFKSRKDRKYCSHKCQPIWNKGTKGVMKAWNKGKQDYNSKENHWNWKGGISLERDRIESSGKYKEFKRKLFKRDNNMCRHCGSKENLETHHIKGWEKYPELRMDMDNCLVLCNKCHLNTRRKTKLHSHQ